MFDLPLGLLGLLALPAVLALHLFRRRFRPRPATALFLWAEVDRTPLSGRTRERLLTSRSLWLELLAAALLALALAGPRGCAPESAPHVVLVLDASASMRGAPEAAARRAVTERLDAAQANARVTLVEAGAEPRLLAGPRAPLPEARARLAEYAAFAPRADLTRAVLLAERLAIEGAAEQDARGAVTAWTDRLDDEIRNLGATVVAVGEAADNVALLHPAREPDGASDEQVSASCASFARERRTTRVVLEALDGDAWSELGARAVELAPDELARVAFRVPTSDRPLRLRLAGEDALDLDDTAWLAPLPTRALALWSDLAADERDALGLRTAGSAPDSLDRWIALVDDAIAAASLEQADLALLGPGGGRRAPEGATVLELASVPDDRREAWIGPYLVERRHPLLDGVVLDEVLWTADPGFASSGVPLVSAGDVPLLVARDGPRAGQYVLNLAPRTSSLTQTPDWPILLTNLAVLAREQLPGPGRVQLTVGEELAFRAPADVAVRRTGPHAGPVSSEEIESSAPTGRVAFPAFRLPGRYTVTAEGGVEYELGVCLQAPSESDLRSRTSGRIDVSAPSVTARTDGASSSRTLLVVLALLLVALDVLAVAPGRRRSEP